MRDHVAWSVCSIVAGGFCTPALLTSTFRRAEGALGGQHGGGPRALVGDVEAGEASAGPELVGESGAACGVDAADHHVRSLRVKGAHVARALAAGPTGHEHGLVVEAGHRMFLRYVGDDRDPR